MGEGEGKGRGKGRKKTPVLEAVIVPDVVARHACLLQHVNERRRALPANRDHQHLVAWCARAMHGVEVAHMVVLEPQAQICCLW